MDTKFIIESHFSNNAVIILDMLAEGDLQTAKRLHEELRDLSVSDEASYSHYILIHNKAELLLTLDKIENQCGDGLRPIIHFDAHGDKEAGLQVGRSGEIVSWDQISKKLLAINTKTKNNLGVVMAACYGLYAIKPTKLPGKCPFYFLIGADEPVEAGLIRDEMKRFYKKLFTSNSYDEAVKEVDTKFRQFHSEKFFCIVFGKYVRQACMGKGKDERIERLFTEIFNLGPIIRNRANYRLVRKELKKSIKSIDNQRAAFFRLGREFLHGDVAISFEEYRKYLNSLNHNNV